MYYNNGQEDELGFDAFIAPDDFDRHVQPVDIYEVFKYWYPLNNQARYIYYYSDGNYPLTLTPTASEYYKYGYTQGGVDVVVDLALNAAPVTIFGETLTTKRWVIVYRVSMAKFTVYLEDFKGSLWIYVGDRVDVVRNQRTHSYFTTGLVTKYIHYANLNSFDGKTSSLNQALNNTDSRLSGRLIFPETISDIGYDSYGDLLNVFHVNFPATKNVYINLTADIYGALGNNLIEINFGASTSLSTPFSSVQLYFSNLSRISVSPQNTGYASFGNCDIIYTKDLTVLHWLAPKTVRGLILPDQLPQAQITALGTKLSANIMQGYPLYIGTLITDIANLYLSNKSFTTIEVGAGNTAFSASGNMLIKTDSNSLIKAGTSNTGDLIIPNVTSIEANTFLRCTGYAGNLSIPSSVTSIASGALNGLTNMTSLTLPVGFDTVIYSYFGFANFNAASLNTSILNLASGTVGTPKYFFISKTSFDALNGAYPNAVSDAAERYINVSPGIIQDSSLKLWLDAGNALSYPGSGTVWSDLSGNGNNGTLVNGVAYSGANGGVMSFDGVDDYVNCGNINVNTEITISVWFKSSINNKDRGIIGKWKTSAESDNSYLIVTELQTDKFTGTIYLSTNARKSVIASDLPFTINTWYNVVMVASNGVLKMYVNGVKSTNTTAYAGGIKQTSRPTLIGKLRIEDNVYASNQIVNDTLIYDRGLSDSEITQNFEATRYKYGI